MIISEQKNLGYDFTPKGEKMFYLYDSEVNDGSLPKTYLAYSGTSVSRRNIQVLTVETEPQTDVHVALEFLNNSGSDFYGHDGDRILAGSKFYLFGTLKYADAINNTDGPLASIFVQDHVTSVSFRVPSLAEAYSTIPDMRDPFLSVGVTADVSWVLSTPVSIGVK